ncbi:Fic family protein [Luteolibacter ambystomatis]|uniref:Fic family protein n=1 Tax=Luteolibacter ambystomatis TaxID=2824561 RepID=A0A975J1I0_9BACT|nr:Fic family protein [Luteolibacter ambystomatis]QUE52262.1 Fic family protein [Luteolibacter ambystomatis]
MDWNWQLAEWPNFRWEDGHNREQESAFLVGSGVLIGAFQSLAVGEANSLRAELLSDEALETSRIEGELLNRDSLQSSIRRQFGLAVDSRKVAPAEQGVSEVMVDAFRSYADDLSDAKLFKWHSLLMRGRVGLKDVGRYRRSKEPMQIVSGPLHAPKVHFEAPAASAIPKEMKGFLKWFNGSRGELPALCRAALAHVYFESIHPFEDGNGRIGRVISEIALSQAVGAPMVIALSQVISAGKKEYYSQLEKANRRLDVAEWVAYFSATVLEAQRRAQRRIEFLIEKAKLFDRLRGKLNVRQEKVLIRVFAEGPDGFNGGLSAKNYAAIAKASTATVTRDLNELLEFGALRKTGERKSTRYWLLVEGQ